MRPAMGAAAALLLGAGGCGGSVTSHAEGPRLLDAAQGAAFADAAVDAFDMSTRAEAALTEDGDPPSDSPHDMASLSSDSDVACQRLAGDACVGCCAANHREGQAELDLVAHGCQCSSCTTSCQASTCQSAAALPQSPCIACVKQSLANECAANGYLDQFCGDAECRAYLACFTQCSD